MPDMCVGHDQQMASNLGQPSAFDRAAVYGHVLANFVVIADLKAGGFATISYILRRHADGCIGEKRILRPNFRWTLNRHMRQQAAVFAEVYVPTDHAIGPNAAR